MFSFCEHSVDSSVVIRLEVNFDPEYVMRNIVAVQHNHSTLEMTTYHSKYPLDSIILNERWWNRSFKCGQKHFFPSVLKAVGKKYLFPRKFIMVKLMLYNICIRASLFRFISNGMLNSPLSDWAALFQSVEQGSHRF